ncbi:MAG: glycoside hydrolase family 127 protein [Candidatus Hydrogenedentes bacterium]|nr:glycoside hydrolase family 127 protein [Candidatus Hydrogenedentota bacterium]
MAAGTIAVAVALAAMAAQEGAGMAACAFDLNRVRLLEGVCLDAQEANRKYLHDLDPERLLRNFRITAGLEAPGEPLGGWEKPDCEVRGHFVGHYLSACALMYASAGDEELKARGDAMVAEFAKCQEALGGEYLSAYPAAFWDRLEAMEKPPWAPYYVIHKIMAGLYDMHTLCGNDQALDVLEGMAAYFENRYDGLSIWEWDRLLGVEFGGMAEVLYNLYAITQNPAHRDLAHAFDRAVFLGPLALEHDNLTKIHANTHIPEVIGAARRYEVLGDERYRTAAVYFWERVAGVRMYATGGTSEAEFWGDPNTLAATLSTKNQESCTSYNMLRLTRHLFEWTADPRYADFYERTYFNSILGTQRPGDGMLAYFTPLACGHQRTFGTPCDSFWCCTGTGIESFSKLGDSIYFHDEDGLYVNLFVASELDWREKGLRLEQVTRFPEEEGTTFRFHLGRSVKLALRVRRPYWATEGMEVRVNGEAVRAEAKPGAYAVIERRWRDGDEVQADVPMGLHASPMPDDPEVVAVVYGPVVLAGLVEEPVYFVGDAADPAAWLAPVADKPLTFVTKGQRAAVTFIPLNRVVEERYGVYFPVIEEGGARHRAILAEEEAARRRAERAVDRVAADDPDSEKAHNLQGDKTAAGAWRGKGWRHAPDGWFSWDLAVLPDAPMTLVCVYWGDDVPPRTFDILVDGTKIATQSLNRDKPDAFFEVEYAIPEALTKGKNQVSVRFQAHQGNTAGGVFECAVLKPAP